MDDLTQDFVRNLTDMSSEEQREALRGLINRLDTSNRIDLIGSLVEEGTIVLDRILDLASAPLMREQHTFSELENRFNALRESEEEILANLDTRLNASGTRLDESIEVEQPDPTTADMPEGSSDINVDPPSQNLLDVSLEVASPEQGLQAMSMGMNQGDMGEREREMERLRQQLGTTTNYQSPDVDLRTGYQNPSSQPDTWPYGEWVREAEERINSGQDQQGNSSNPASDPELAALEADMNMNMNSGQGQQGDSSNPASDPELAALERDMNDMNWRNIVASERPPTQVENYTGNARKKKTKKKRRKSKKKKKPYEDLIMTQKKRLAKLQKMSEKLSKKMSKTKKKRRKKKVSDSY